MIWLAANYIWWNTPRRVQCLLKYEIAAAKAASVIATRRSLLHLTHTAPSTERNGTNSGGPIVISKRLWETPRVCACVHPTAAVSYPYRLYVGTYVCVHITLHYYYVRYVYKQPIATIHTHARTHLSLCIDQSIHDHVLRNTEIMLIDQFTKDTV